jgi:CubicO group peptidase (beta-lactamase class C family)
LYLKNEWQDTMLTRIVKSAPPRVGRYSYSDNDFIFLGKIVEQLSGMTLDQYVQKNFLLKTGIGNNRV